jgi:hypothetical protein
MSWPRGFHGRRHLAPRRAPACVALTRAGVCRWRVSRLDSAIRSRGAARGRTAVRDPRRRCVGGPCRAIRGFADDAQHQAADDAQHQAAGDAQHQAAGDAQHQAAGDAQHQAASGVHSASPRLGRIHSTEQRAGPGVGRRRRAMARVRACLVSPGAARAD